MGHQNPKKYIFWKIRQNWVSQKKIWQHDALGWNLRDGVLSHTYIRDCNSLNIYQKCSKKPQVPEIHIFQKIKSDLGQLGPWACKLAQNMYKNSAKLSKTCLKLRCCYSLNIYWKCSKKTTGTWDTYISENQVRFGPTWPMGP